MPKIGWLDSVEMRSGIHIVAVDGGDKTLCGYPTTANFNSKWWIPYRVGGHRTHKCQTCFNLAKKNGLDKTNWDNRCPPPDTTIIVPRSRSFR